MVRALRRIFESAYLNSRNGATVGTVFDMLLKVLSVRSSLPDGRRGQAMLLVMSYRSKRSLLKVVPSNTP